MKVLIESLQMAGLAVTSVSLWTLRVALTARGRKVAGAVTAGLEAVVFILVFSRVADDLAAIERLLGYAVGCRSERLQVYSWTSGCRPASRRYAW